MKKENVIIYTNGLLNVDFAKTCHGLLRGTNRFNILGVIDSVHFGKDSGEVLDGRPRGIYVFETIEAFLQKTAQKPKYCVIGVAFPGGMLPETCRAEIIQAMKNGMSIICGLHQLLGDDPQFRQIARENGVELIDIRKPRPTSELHFWTGEIFSVKTPIIAVLGTDCAIGKRTTCRFIMESCNAYGIKTEMIYTGQTGWMQGYKHGFIFDATANDFISGEIDRVILECDRESSPDLILIEGQSSLRNPTGPCGSEFLLSRNVKGVILQHVPARVCFIDLEEVGCLISSIESEIELIKMYGVKTLAVTLNEEGWDDDKTRIYQEQLSEKLSIPVIRPLKDGVEKLVPVIREFMENSA